MCVAARCSAGFAADPAVTADPAGGAAFGEDASIAWKPRLSSVFPSVPDVVAGAALLSPRVIAGAA